MIPAPQFTDEQRAALQATITSTMRAIEQAARALAEALAKAAQGFAQLQAAFVLEPDATPYDTCICPPTDAGLTLCGRCPGNTTKEPTS